MRCRISQTWPKTYTTSPQHKDSTEARIKRDASDLEKIRIKLAACSPFTSDPTLRNIVNGIVAGPDVNVQDFDRIGWEQDHWRYNLKVGIYLQFQVERQSPNPWEYLCCEDCSWSYHWSCPSVQRFLLVSRSDLSLEEVFDVWTKPPTLLPSLRPEHSSKSRQTSAWDHVADLSSEAVINSIPKTDCYVLLLDGGSLLHRSPWKKGDSYNAIAESYADFTVKHYGQATVVSDGYGEGPSIKDNTNQRRGKTCTLLLVSLQKQSFQAKRRTFCLVTKTWLLSSAQH